MRCEFAAPLRQSGQRGDAKVGRVRHAAAPTWPASAAFQREGKRTARLCHHGKWLRWHVTLTGEDGRGAPAATSTNLGNMPPTTDPCLFALRTPRDSEVRVDTSRVELRKDTRQEVGAA